MKDRALADADCNEDSSLDEEIFVTGAQHVALYVDRSTRQWVVRDPRGDFWRLPSDDNAWDHREPFPLTVDSELEIVPGHYRYMLDLPF